MAYTLQNMDTHGKLYGHLLMEKRKSFMFCKFCQAELPENVTLCPACGKENQEEILEVAAEEIQAETEEAVVELNEEAAAELTEETQQNLPETTKKQNKLWVTLLAIVGAVALAAVLIVAVLYGVGVFDHNTDTYVVSDAKAMAASGTVVATAGDEKLTNSELQVYYQQAFEDFYSYYSYYMDLTTIGLDTSKPLAEQYYDQENGITWEAYFVETALNTWHRYAALTMQAKEDGYTLNAETQAYLDSIPEQLETMAKSYEYDSVEEFLRSDLGPACDLEGYLKFLNTNFYAGQYFDSLYEELAPTMEEIEAYFEANAAELEASGVTKDTGKTVDVRHILICPQGGSEAEDGSWVYSDEEWESCRKEAPKLLDQGRTEDGTEEGFAQYAMDHTQDPGSQSTGGLYTDVYVGQVVEPFEDWCFDESRVYGDTGLVQTTYGYHIMFYVADHEIWISSVESQIINERSMERVSEAVAKWPMEVNQKKIVLGDTSKK